MRATTNLERRLIEAFQKEIDHARQHARTQLPRHHVEGVIRLLALAIARHVALVSGVGTERRASLPAYAEATPPAGTSAQAPPFQ